MGHSADVCRSGKPPQSTLNYDTRNKPPATPIKKPLPLDQVTCFNCNKKGHYASNCSSPRNNIGYKPLPTVKRLQVEEPGATTMNLKECEGKHHSESSDVIALKRVDSHDATTAILKECEGKHYSESSDVIALKVANTNNDVINFEKRTGYGIHTPCVLDGQRILAFVDGGASTSFISKNSVDKLGWKVEPLIGVIKLALHGMDTPRIGVVTNKLLENGHHRFPVKLEVANLGDAEDLIIGLDLFPQLGYEIANVPFTWPSQTIEQIVKKPQHEISSEDNGVVDEWKQVLADNQALPKDSRCLLKDSELAINTIGEPVWIRQYPMPQ